MTKIIDGMYLPGSIVHVDPEEYNYDYEYERWQSLLTANKIEELRDVLVEGHCYSFYIVEVEYNPNVPFDQISHISALSSLAFRYEFTGSELYDDEIGFINLFTPESKFIGPGNAWRDVDAISLNVYKED